MLINRALICHLSATVCFFVSKFSEIYDLYIIYEGRKILQLEFIELLII